MGVGKENERVGAGKTDLQPEPQFLGAFDFWMHSGRLFRARWFKRADLQTVVCRF